MSARTRAQLVSDAFGLTEANYITNGVAFELAKYLINELDYLPWTTFLNRIKYFIDLFDSTSTYAKMQNFLADIVTPYYRKLGWFENVDTDAWNDRLDSYLKINFSRVFTRVLETIGYNKKTESKSLFLP